MRDELLTPVDCERFRRTIRPIGRATKATSSIGTARTIRERPGPGCSAHSRKRITKFGDKERACPASPLQTQLAGIGIGSLAEIYDGDAPQRPNGCIAQAWSVGETLRVWQQLHGNK